MNDPRIRPPAAAAVQAIVRHESRERQVFLAVAAGVALLFTALTALKGKQVELACAAAGVAPRPVVRGPVQLRACWPVRRWRSGSGCSCCSSLRWWARWCCSERWP